MISLAQNQNKHLGRIIHLPEENLKPLFVVSFTQANREESENFKKLLRKYLESPKQRIMYTQRADGTMRRVTPYWFTRLFRKYVINKWKFFLVNFEWDYKSFVSEIKERYLSNGIKGVFNL